MHSNRERADIDVERPARAHGMARLFSAGLVLASIPFVTQIEGGDTSLRTLTGVAVVGEATAPDVRAYGLDESWLEDQVSGHLRRADVPLLARTGGFTTMRQPLLVVRLQTLKLPTSRTFAWFLSLAVHQRTATLGAVSDTVLTQTWAASGTLGVTSGRNLKGSVRETLEIKVAEFVKAWRSQRR